MAEGYLYDRGDELIERKDLSESLVPEIDPDTDEGKVLAVDSEGKAGWETPESGLPAITPTTDRGKILTVGDDDEPEWGTVSAEEPYVIFNGYELAAYSFTGNNGWCQLNLPNTSGKDIDDAMKSGKRVFVSLALWEDTTNPNSDWITKAKGHLVEVRESATSANVYQIDVLENMIYDATSNAIAVLTGSYFAITAADTASTSPFTNKQAVNSVWSKISLGS